MAELQDLRGTLKALADSGGSAKVSFYYVGDDGIALRTGAIHVDRGQYAYLDHQKLSPQQAVDSIVTLKLVKIAVLEMAAVSPDASLTAVALPDLDPDGYARDLSPREHGVDLLIEKWADTEYGPGDGDRVRVDIDCPYSGGVSERCMEFAALDRVREDLLEVRRGEEVDLTTHGDDVVTPLGALLGDGELGRHGGGV